MRDWKAIYFAFWSLFFYAMKNEFKKDRHLLVDLIDSRSLEAINRMSKKKYRRTKRIKDKITCIDKSISTYELKMIMEERPRGRLYGR